MVLKNHMVSTDPESPQKNVFNNFNSAHNDDPWYQNSGAPSPVGGNESKGFNYSMYSAPDIPSSNLFSDMNGAAGGNNFNGGVNLEEDYENEPPLLEELGIRFDHMLSKTQAVMYPFKVCLFLFR